MNVGTTSHAQSRPEAGAPCVVAGLLLAATCAAPGALYTVPNAIEGTAVNSTNVIGAEAEGNAYGVNFTNGAQTWLNIPNNTIDAGQFSDSRTMYLRSSSGGVLALIRNEDGVEINGFGSLGIDVFGVSGAIQMGGTIYCVVASPSSGIRALNLTNGEMTAIPGSYNFDTAQGLDAFLRPGGTTLDHLAVGIQRGDFTDPFLNLYTNGVLLNTFDKNNLFLSQYGQPNDVSFDLAQNKIWIGTLDQFLYDRPFNFAAYAVTPPTVSVAWTNGSVTVTWTGRTLQASADLTNWTAVATAPASPTQLFPPPPYVEPATHATRFFRARW